MIVLLCFELRELLYTSVSVQSKYFKYNSPATHPITVKLVKEVEAFHSALL